jgi:copper resistance protein B
MKRIKGRIAMKPHSLFAASMVLLGTTPVWAQTTATGSGHTGHHVTAPTPAPTKSAEIAAGATMDHGSMNMQGGPEPADARDPHAYSGGLTLETGPYALPGPRQLRLSDEHAFGSVLFDRLERVYTKDGNATAYDAQAWFGGTYDRLVVKAEGDVAKGKLEDARTEVLWGHAVASYWDTQLGVRQDSGQGPDLARFRHPRARAVLVQCRRHGLRRRLGTYGAAPVGRVRAPAHPTPDSAATNGGQSVWSAR